MPVSILKRYEDIVGTDVIDQLRQLAEPLKDFRVIHINSTRKGGGVAEILEKLVPLKRELGIEADWKVISGTPEFFKCTKSMHNALQGNRIELPDSMLKTYEEINMEKKG